MWVRLAQNTQTGKLDAPETFAWTARRGEGMKIDGQPRERTIRETADAIADAINASVPEEPELMMSSIYWRGKWDAQQIARNYGKETE